jgi:hypothetical protein
MRRHERILASLAILGAILSACQGGGSSSTSPTLPTRTVGWVPPQYFADNTPLDPARDLKGIEIHVKQDASFGPADIPAAIAPPSDNHFVLSTLDPPLSRGVTYYVSVRAVTNEGVKSDFSAIASFSFPP